VVIGQRLFRPWADDWGERGCSCRSDGWGPRVPPYTLGFTRQPKRMLAKRAFMADQCAPVGLDVLLEQLYSTRPKSHEARGGGGLHPDQDCQRGLRVRG
jgi:hypothetical protein